MYQKGEKLLHAASVTHSSSFYFLNFFNRNDKNCRLLYSLFKEILLKQAITILLLFIGHLSLMPP
ncbi:Hypothetical protein Minf_1210 [Methylacidiphilum infernorum V4]|uniref:Uncharacterized protein n=1 Tax=Methylacidiphilum infernorum (isolate V4) TaxID=481448 RepID=B3DVB2_METI4|nr:Hypothetical protein Minf_1210 [Methylacidiphilum infernorum V4]